MRTVHVSRTRSIAMWATGIALLALAVAWMTLGNSSRSRFQEAVALLRPGMSAEQVALIMRDQVEGAFGRHAQLVEGESYYEPAGEKRSYDEYCRIVWLDGVVAQVISQAD